MGELRITNQTMYLHPPIEWTRQEIVHELFAWEQVILGLSRIQHSRYQVVQESSSELNTTYKSVLTRLPDGPEVLEVAYEAVNKLVKEVDVYVNVSMLFGGI